MDLMTLAAKIVVDDSGFNQGIEGAEKKGKALAGKMSAMTVAVGNIASDMIKKGIDGIKNVIDGAISGYANYEQLVGGVETLFKSSANRIQKYARESFKTTGLSANEYMETVTSFSASLIQGLKGDTETAAEVANMAVTDMADNANKMGTDMSSIQAAYQGFAKQNYTMLDNLKLGYGGTASEMVRLVNDSKILDHEIKDLDGITFDQLVQAIHAIQDQLGVTGTTAEEAASTIGGSENSLKSAWKDLLTAVAGTDESTTKWFNDPLNDTLKNFQESFSTYIDNLVPTIVNSVANSGTLVEGIADAIASLPTDLMAKIGEKGVKSATKVVSGISKITNWLIDSISNVFKSASANEKDIENFGKSIGEFIGKAINKLAQNIPAILEGLKDIGINIAKGLVEGLYEGLFGTDSQATKIADELQSQLTDVEVNSAKAQGILGYMQSLYDQFGNAAERMTQWQEAKAQLEEAVSGSGQIWEQYKGDIQGAIDALAQYVESMKHTAMVAGMQKSQQALWELYGQQVDIKYRAQARKGAAQETIKAQKEVEGIREDLVRYAEETIAAHLEEWVETDEEGTPLLNSEGKMMFKAGLNGSTINYANALYALQQGYLMDYDKSLNGELVDINELGYKDLVRLMQSLGDEDYEAVFGMRDQIIEEAQATIAEANSQISAANKEIAAAIREIELGETALAKAEEEWRRSGQKKQSVEELEQAKSALSETAEGIDGTQNAIRAANKKIELEGNAVEGAAGEMKEAGTQAANTIQSGGSTAGNAITAGGEKIGKALDKIAKELEKFKVSVPKKSGDSDDDSGDSDSSDSSDTQLAVGMDYVPSNGYKAELHEGEAVLTKAENKQRMSGSNADIVGAIQSLRQDLQNLRIVVGQKVFGHAVVDYGGDGLNRYISGANSRYEAGYGV